MDYSTVRISQFYILCFICLSLISCKPKGKTPLSTETAETVFTPDTLRLLFVGDVIVHSTVYNSARHEGGDSSYYFNSMFQHIKEYISSADISMANLEVPFGGRPYSGYPMFSSPSDIADALKDTGFDLLFTANNHASDRGRKGLENTIDYLDKLGLKHVGSYKDSLDKQTDYPLSVEKKGIRLAILNYTYDTNGMPVYAPNQVNLIDTVEIKADLRKAKEQNPDLIITCMHWGYEYHNKESKEQQELARFLAENGTDLIIGGHPHVVQPFDTIITEKNDTVPVIYSVGNFISNQQWRYADGGISFEAVIVKSENKTSIHSVGYEPLWVNRYTNAAGRNLYRIIPVNNYFKMPEKYNLSEDQILRMTQFYNDTRLKLPNLNDSGFYQFVTL